MRKGQLLEAILEQKDVVHKDGWNVVTSQRRDVPTSRRPHVATSPRRDVPTSRRPHVVTSPRRDVGSTNLKVNKWQRRDASTS